MNIGGLILLGIFGCIFLSISRGDKFSSLSVLLIITPAIIGIFYSVFGDSNKFQKVHLFKLALGALFFAGVSDSFFDIASSVRTLPFAMAYMFGLFSPIVLIALVSVVFTFFGIGAFLIALTQKTPKQE